MLETTGGRTVASLRVAESSLAYGTESPSQLGSRSGTPQSPVPSPQSGAPNVRGVHVGVESLFCNVCSHQWAEGVEGRRFRSIDDLIRTTGLRRDEVTVLAEIGALNSLGHDRRSALWQVERAIRPAGELFAEHGQGEEAGQDDTGARGWGLGSRAGQEHLQRDEVTLSEAASSGSVTTARPSPQPPVPSPLPEMSAGERLVADYAGTGLTVGPHPMRFRRHELSMKGVLRAIDLPHVKSGRRVRTAGMVITRQRPGTAKGFVFLTLEDETGISNIIIRPDVYARDRAIVVESPFLLVDGWLQVQDGVTAIRAERMERIEGLLATMAVESHDFH